MIRIIDAKLASQIDYVKKHLLATYGECIVDDEYVFEQLIDNAIENKQKLYFIATNDLLKRKKELANTPIVIFNPEYLLLEELTQSSVQFEKLYIIHDYIQYELTDDYASELLMLFNVTDVLENEKLNQIISKYHDGKYLINNNKKYLRSMAESDGIQETQIISLLTDLKRQYRIKKQASYWNLKEKYKYLRVEEDKVFKTRFWKFITSDKNSEELLIDEHTSLNLARDLEYLALDDYDEEKLVENLEVSAQEIYKAINPALDKLEKEYKFTTINYHHTEISGYQAGKVFLDIENNEQYILIDKNKNMLITLLGGLFGIHRFYNRKMISGYVYLLTLGLFGFGWLIDIIQAFNKDEDYYIKL